MLFKYSGNVWLHIYNQFWSRTESNCAALMSKDTIMAVDRGEKEEELKINFLYPLLT